MKARIDYTNGQSSGVSGFVYLIITTRLRALLGVGPAEVIDSTREDRINSFVKRLSTPFLL